MEEKFEYEYKSHSLEEKNEIKSIKEQYIEKDKMPESKFERLRSLHSKVQSIPIIYGLTFGIVGTLLFGTGLTFFLEWASFWYIGIPFSILGIVIALFAYPLYKFVLKNLKNKYRQ